MYLLTGVSVLWDVVVIFCNSNVILTLNDNFLVVPLYSDSDMTTDNAYPNTDTTVHSQHCTVLRETKLQSQGYLSAILFINLFFSNLITSLSLKPITVPVILHGKLCRALLA